jgi:ferritin
MKKKLLDAINTQIKNEFYSAYLYLSMAAYFDSVNLTGFAGWMKQQAKEEVSHAMKFYDFLNSRGEKVVLEAIDKPPSKFSSPQDVFEKSLAHEKKVTSMINKLYDLATAVDDKSASVLLQWYISEQVEEENSISVILDKLKLVKPDSAAMIMLDSLLGKRATD